LMGTWVRVNSLLSAVEGGASEEVEPCGFAFAD